MAAPVQVSRLGAMDEIDSGSFGTVYRLSSHTLPGFTDLAYKRFAGPPDPAEVANLRALIDFRVGLDPAARAILDDAAAWPLRLVSSGGVVCGFVMQLIAPEFFGTQVLPSGATVSLPVKAQWLVVDPARADAGGIAVPRANDIPARIVLCAKLAHLYGVLHRAGFVYGDLSLNNVMFSAGSPPKVMVVDCDAVQSPRSAPIGQAHTDDWMPPESVAGPRAQDIASDRYKLALFILRVLTPGPHASQATDPDRMVGVLDLHGNTMMREGLSADRGRRPSAKHWYTHLTGYLGQLTSPPEFGSVGVDTTVAPVGPMVSVCWRVTGATRVTVTAADGHTVRADAAAGGCRVSVTRSGPFTLRAENRYGAATVDTDPVIVLHPPRINRLDVAPIVLPRTDTGMQQLGAALTAVREHPPVPAGAFVLPDFAPLRSTAFPLPEVLARPGPPAIAPTQLGSAAGAVTELLTALRADAATVVERARTASAAAARTAGESVTTV